MSDFRVDGGIFSTNENRRTAKLVFLVIAGGPENNNPKRKRGMRGDGPSLTLRVTVSWGRFSDFAILPPSQPMRIVAMSKTGYTMELMKTLS